MADYNTNEEVKRLDPRGELRSKAKRIIHGLHGKKSPGIQRVEKPNKNPVVLIAEKIGEGIKQVVNEISSIIPGDSSQQEVKMSALEQFRQLQAARKVAAEKKAEEAKQALVHNQVQGLRNPIAVEEGGRVASRGLSPELRNKLRAAQASAIPTKSVSPPKWTVLPATSNANKRRANAVRRYLTPKKRRSPKSSEEAEEVPGSEENVGNNQKGMASQNKPANAVAAGNAAANAAAAAGASPAVVNATANAVANAVANAPPGQEGLAAAAAAEQAVVEAGGNVEQAGAASEAASANAGGNANAEAEANRLEAEAEAQEAARAAAGAAAASGAPPAAVEAAAAAAESGAPPAEVEAAVVNAGGSPAAGSNAAAASGNANAGAANRLAALSPVLSPVAGAGVAANAPAILAAAAPANRLVPPGLPTSPLPIPGGAPCPPVGLAPGTYTTTVQETMGGDTVATFKRTGGLGTSWSMPKFSLKSGKGKTVPEQVKEQPKAWTWKGVNFGKWLEGLKGFTIDLTPLLAALETVATVAGGAAAAAVAGPVYGAYLIGQGFVIIGLAIAGAFQSVAGYDFRKIYPGITLANLFGLGTDPRMKKLAKAISEYQTLNKQGIQQVVNAAKQARSSRFSNNTAVQNRVEAEIKTVKRLLADKQADIKAAAKGIAAEIADDLFSKLSKEQEAKVDAQLEPIKPVYLLPNVGGRNLTVNRQTSAAINEIKDDFTELNVLVEKMYLAAAALGNVPEAQYPMAKAEAIRTAYAQFLKDVQVLDELQQLAQGANAKKSVNAIWNKTQKYRSNVASYGRAAQQGLSGFGSRIGSMFTRKVNASKPNSSGYVPGVIGSNRYTNANRAAQAVALAPAAPVQPKKGFFGRLGNTLKTGWASLRGKPAAVQKLTAAPANSSRNELANLRRLAANRGEQYSNLPVEANFSRNLPNEEANVSYRGTPTESGSRGLVGPRGYSLGLPSLFGRPNSPAAQARRAQQAANQAAPQWTGTSTTPGLGRKTRKGRKAGRR